MIMQVLSDNQIHSLHDISKRSQLHWVTVQKYLQLINYLQDCPKITLLKCLAGKQDRTMVQIEEDEA